MLDSALWLGAGPPGWLALQLPIADPAVLRTGNTHLVALALDLQGATASVQPLRWRLGLV